MSIITYRFTLKVPVKKSKKETKNTNPKLEYKGKAKDQMVSKSKKEVKRVNKKPTAEADLNNWIVLIAATEKMFSLKKRAYIPKK